MLSMLGNWNAMEAISKMKAMVLNEIVILMKIKSIDNGKPAQSYSQGKGEIS